MLESVPVYLGYCKVPLHGRSDCVPSKNIFFIGTASDSKAWVQEAKEQSDIKVGLILCVASVVLGVLSLRAKV